MTDLCRLIFWTLVDLMRARATLEAEIWVLRQQINVLRRAAPRRQSFVFLIGRYLLASIDFFPRLAMRWRSSSRILSSVGIVRVSERIGAGSRDVVVADQPYPRTYASLSTR